MKVDSRFSPPSQSWQDPRRESFDDVWPLSHLERVVYVLIVALLLVNLIVR
jgi:hypothetical protein